MNPSPCKPTANPAKITRRVLCAHYSSCLDQAIKSKWDGFSCGSCGEYQEEDTTGAAHWQGQAECCGKLLKAIFIDRPKKGPGDSCWGARAGAVDVRATYLSTYKPAPFNAFRPLPREGQKTAFPGGVCQDDQRHGRGAEVLAGA